MEMLMLAMVLHAILTIKNFKLLISFQAGTKNLKSGIPLILYYLIVGMVHLLLFLVFLM